MLSILFRACTPLLLISAQAPPAAEPEGLEALRIGHWDEIELDLPSVAPEHLEVIVHGPEGPRTLLLVRHSNRSEDFRLLVQVEDGSLVDVPPPPVSTYRGLIAEDPTWNLAATLLPTGLKLCARRTDGSAWYIEPMRVINPRARRSQHLVYTQSDLTLGSGFCGTEQLDIAPVSTPTSNSSVGSGCFREAQIAFDADYENFLLNGSDISATSLNIEASLNAVNDMYAREVAISHVLTQVIVRSVEPDPYPSFVPGTLLDSFRLHWNSQQSGVTRDMAHLATGKEMDGNIIGLAWVGVVCNQAWSYGLTQYNLGFGGIVSVLAHELGHNWNAPHCLDFSCVIMCGGCMQFGPITTQVVLDFRDNVGCLDTTNGHATAVPPKVRNESLELDGPVTIDVLANDFDGNCDPLVIQSFDAISSGGAVVTLSPGTGPDGRDELVYTPSETFEGLDTVSYEVADGTGLSTEGLISIELYDDFADLALHYRFDETSGSEFIDSSVHGIDGNHVGSPNLGLGGAAPGTLTAVAFDGAFARGTAPGLAPLNGLDSELCVALWVRPENLNGSQFLFGNSDSWDLRLIDSDLMFRTSRLDYVLSPGPSAGVWTHVAAVYDSNNDVSFYINGALASLVPGDEPTTPPQGQWLIAGGGTSFAAYHGRLDDLQVYDNVLDAADILWLFQNPGQTIVECEPMDSFCAGAPNSVGPGAVIGASGSPSLQVNNLALSALGCPPNKTGLFYFGSNAISVPFGDGLRCVGGSIKRLAPMQTDALGFASQPIDLSAPPFDSGSGAAIPGQTQRFQFWYRDPDAGGSGFNLSDAVSVKYCL